MSPVCVEAPRSIHKVDPAQSHDYESSFRVNIIMGVRVRERVRVVQNNGDLVE